MLLSQTMMGILLPVVLTCMLKIIRDTAGKSLAKLIGNCAN